ncbi:hypothetical protein [Pseudoduganella violaceinigra]|uniref:hypothetical protein n=1 Tax=Pseudoduganella violaceinigra TaxID=246602 RepID=UPI00048131DF|nr:hypothetical protein [Pseudoduganella violaceinigra]
MFKVNPRKLKTFALPLGFLLLFAIAAAVSLLISFKAGCAGDTKGGSYGDPVRAIALEDFAFFSMILSSIFGGAAVACMSRPSYRGGAAVGFALLVLMVLWLAGLQVEDWAVHSCFVGL